MSILAELQSEYGSVDCVTLGADRLRPLRDRLQKVSTTEIDSVASAETFLVLLKKFRMAVAENDKLHGDNYPDLLKSLLTVGEDGVYSNNLRFIFELIQNVDDCEFANPEDCKLDIHFDSANGAINLTYNEEGFTPFNVFAITGIAEAAKNISAQKNEIGEKGIGFKSVFGVADKVHIRSGWFSFELSKDNFTIPEPKYGGSNDTFVPGTQMQLSLSADKVREIYRQLADQYCKRDALFKRNPLLFLNKLTSLKIDFDNWRYMEFTVTRTAAELVEGEVHKEDAVVIAIDLQDANKGQEVIEHKEILCTRYTYPVIYSYDACKSRYGTTTEVGSNGGKQMHLHAIVPDVEYLKDVGNGGLYSFLPTQLGLTVPLACHVPFKLDASREFVDPQNENLWFQESCRYFTELLDYVYFDQSRSIKADVIHFLPGAGDNIFAVNNGKERSLREYSGFSGRHFLEQPLFFTVKGDFKRNEDVYCFAASEEIPSPEYAGRFLRAEKEMFLPPEGLSVRKFQIEILGNVFGKIFQRALADEGITREALDYLERAGYTFPEKDLPENCTFSLAQVTELVQHKKAYRTVTKLAKEHIQKNKQLPFVVEMQNESTLQRVLGDDFPLQDAPPIVQKYMSRTYNSCCCAQIEEERFFLGHNGLVLSASDPEASFVEFCNNIFPRAAFTIRLNVRRISKSRKVFEHEFSGSPKEYIQELSNYRKLVKDSLGDEPYKNYVGLILRAGTDSNRFLQEILQNADDCQYADGVTPTFSMKKKDTGIAFHYNEAGFTRADVRAITAIGDSTKNAIIGQNEIGEKGVGFKTVFSIASKVKITSGGFCFSLNAEAPTIPVWEAGTGAQTKGTHLELELKEVKTAPNFSEKELLELCLCLRKLKHITIGNNEIYIQDNADSRVIKIDGKTHTYQRITHSFSIDDAEALAERGNYTRQVAAEQSIICYVPERKTGNYPLYVGLPTKHRINVPLVIDAPFALTTSREELDTSENIKWNTLVRKEMYAALVEVIHAMKRKDKESVIRFTNFQMRRSGSAEIYINEISNFDFINKYSYSSILSKERILPTYDQEEFVAPCNPNRHIYPTVAHVLFRKNDFCGMKPRGVISLDTDKEVIFTVLGAYRAGFDHVLLLLKQNLSKYIRDEEFRGALYDYLEENAGMERNVLKSLPFIPVYARSGGETEYISWQQDCIFVQKGVTASSAGHYVLNTNILSKSSVEKILDVSINEMNEEFEAVKYNLDLGKILREKSSEEIYSYLLSERANLNKYDAWGTVRAEEAKIQLKNLFGNLIHIEEAFICENPSGIAVDILKTLCVHRECTWLAEKLNCKPLSNVHYDDCRYEEELTEDDIEALMYGDLRHWEELIRGFYEDGLCSAELMEAYGIQYLTYDGRDSQEEFAYEFPLDPVYDYDAIENKVRELWENPAKIVKVKVERIISRVRNINGKTFDLDSKEIRNEAMARYSPYGANGKCFCQMCRIVKPQRFIEVNNIELEPEYYLPELRLALCLECSKRFEGYRLNDSIRNSFIQEIKTADTVGKEYIDVPIRQKTIRFTGKHLALVQEILRQKPQ